MIFSGTFKTFDNEQTYSITIGRIGTPITIIDPLEDNSHSLTPNMKVMFAPDPVTITCDRQDLTKRIIISQATIELYSNQDLSPYLFADNNREIPVTITLNGEHVFFGYIDPLQFNQGYAHNYESITINATDPLGALEDKKVDINDQVIKPTAELSPWNILSTMLDRIGINNITNKVNETVYNTMNATKLHCSLFFGSSPDDWKSYYEVIESICKYFNLYIAMNGKDSVVITSTINNDVEPKNIPNFKDLATDDSTSISRDDVYSQVSLTCNIEPLETNITFDDSDFLYSDYDNYEKYMTEYVSCDDNAKAYDAFYAILNGQQTQHNGAFYIDHYMYAMRNDKWDFGPDSYIEALGGMINYDTGATQPMQYDQRYLLNWLAEAPFRAALVGFAEMDKVKLNGTTKDNSLQRNPTLDKCLVISTMGQFDDSSAEFYRYQNLIDDMLENPLCRYRGLDASVLSPTNEKTVNFIVINGSITLNPLQPLSGRYWGNDTQRLMNNWNSAREYFKYGFDENMMGRIGWDHEIHYPAEAAGCSGNVAYYNQFWHYGSSGLTSGSNGVYGFLNVSTNKRLQFNCSSDGQTDNISKMPILCCQIKITTTLKYPDDYPNESLRGKNIVKYCVERLDGGSPVHTWGSTGENNFEWLTQEECDRIGIKPIFTIGIDPKMEDYIIGQKFPISNTIDWRYNLDKTGTCIPIHQQDQLSGTIEFSIVSPYNAQWNNYVRYNTLFWPGGMIFMVGAINILSQIQSIMLSDFKIETTSNNGGISKEQSGKDNDLVYFSDEDPSYVEKLEDDIDICSWLTVDEYKKLGVKNQSSNSYVLKSDNSGFFGWPNEGTEEEVEAKPWIRPEECYVDYMYKEYRTPAKVVSTQIQANAFYDGLYGNAMNYEMLNNYITGIPVVGNSRIMSYETSLKYKTIDLTLREHRTIANEQI